MTARVLERWCAVSPEAPALHWSGRSIHHGDLRSLVARIAGQLAGLGLKRGERVGLALGHGSAAPAALWGCFWGGFVPVPVDTHLPLSRMREILQRAGATALVAEGARGRSLARQVGFDHPVLLADAPVDWTGARLGEGSGVVTAPVETDPEDPALLLFTSGSTGTPKGVTIPGRAIDAFVEHWGSTAGLGPGDRVAWVAALSFDLSIFDLVAGIAFGAEVRPVPEALLAFPTALLRWIVEHGITHWYSVPSLWVSLVDAGLPGTDSALRCGFYAGEPMSGLDARRIRLAMPSMPLWNLFGPTETNVNAAYALLVDFAEDNVPIGPAMPYLALELVDEDGTVGDDGEIQCSGGTTMLGYWGEPDRAQWVERGGRRWLRTGDRARRRPDGALLFLGRADRMVKIDGFRVEPEEVEVAARSIDGVREAAVVVDRTGDRAALHLHLVGGCGEGQVLDALRRVLPRFAVPTVVHRWDALPRTARGKVDLVALANGVRHAGPDPSAA